MATTDYFFGYQDNCGKVAWADITDVIERYLAHSTSAVELRMRSDAYFLDPAAAQREKALGYSRLGADNAFWWQK